ncbi:helix-turn-helix domain-containing protein [Macrococcoides caseolyticum]|uniref:helix-turn-helix domain-containing protein n=1 Tax=Macrococcoides caseolyticum TaxID=69966 RepID=UPI000C339BF2|nr:helix-turn-helix transcriptional regulator [Macrococcus caseolyticus]PKE22491.1 phage repressor protein [Macrococcus caseolyticus]
MVDVEELKRVMVNKGVTNERLSEELNIDPSTLYRRLKNKGSKFNIEEAQKIKEVLNLSDRAAIKIFFKK